MSILSIPAFLEAAEEGRNPRKKAKAIERRK
jgi:hypothetical protein